MGDESLNVRGPSPRARGSPGSMGASRLASGSIPAGAGKPSPDTRGWMARRVHPRGRGEASFRETCGQLDLGPSPRARGSRNRTSRPSPASGSIPAGAGKPSRRGPSTTPARGPSPRARGSRQDKAAPVKAPRSIPAGAGKPPPDTTARGRPTVHPRGRGEADDRQRHVQPDTGPSPRARGSRRARPCPSWPPRSIPAGAGKPWRGYLAGDLYRVHPRGRGEAAVAAFSAACRVGPSPRARGSRPEAPHGALTGGSIPAGAGKPRSSSAWRWCWRVHPRGRGEAGVEVRGRGEAGPRPLAVRMGQGPSPWARGSLPCPMTANMTVGSIPAGAGKPSTRTCRTSANRVHPRGRGEAVDQQATQAPYAGPSPRARGSLR